MNISIIKNVWAVGRNYAEHAKEMNADVPKEPMFFLKAGSTLETGSVIRLPEWSKEVHHELELAYWVDEDLNYSHVALAIDLTARDAQNLAKSKGQPWTLSKSFKAACPISSWISLDNIQSQSSLQFVLIKNGQKVQQGNFGDMLFKPDQLLNHVKTYYPLSAYDVILTGTPSGVSSLNHGDSLQAVLQSEKREILACHWDVI